MAITNPTARRIQFEDLYPEITYFTASITFSAQTGTLTIPVASRPKGPVKYYRVLSINAISSAGVEQPLVVSTNGPSTISTIRVKSNLFTSGTYTCRVIMARINPKFVDNGTV